MLAVYQKMKFELIEPLNTYLKDEVRALGEALGLPREIVWRQPFPGPGLGIRVLGEVTEEKLEMVRDSDFILRDVIAKRGLENEIWQYFTALPDIRSVGVMGGCPYLRLCSSSSRCNKYRRYDSKAGRIFHLKY